MIQTTNISAIANQLAKGGSTWSLYCPHNIHHHVDESTTQPPQATNYQNITEKPTKSQHDERVRINVSGEIFETFKRTLTSKEGSIFKLNNVMNYYDKKNGEFYFNRNSKAFEYILVYLQSGILHKPDNVPENVFIQELQFFGFGNTAQRIFNEGIGKEKSKQFQDCKTAGFKQYLWQVLEYPDINLFAKIIAIISCFLILLSILILCVETLPQFKTGRNYHLKAVETFCIMWFTVELLVRFLCTEHRLRFLSDVMNIIDFISILPFYIGLVFAEAKRSDMVAFAIMRILRLLRVFRIFKLSRYSKAIRLIMFTIRASIRELILLVFFVVIVMILFSAVIYYCEADETDETNKFRSIPHIFWLCIVTITTVGYGDIVPITPGNYYNKR